MNNYVKKSVLMHARPHRDLKTRPLAILLCIFAFHFCLPAIAQHKPIKVTNWSTLSLGAAQKNFYGQSFTSNIDVSWKRNKRFYHIGLAYFSDRSLGLAPDFSALRTGIGYAYFQRFGGFFIYSGPQLGFARLRRTEAERQQQTDQLIEPKPYTTFALGMNTAIQLYITPIREFGFSISYFYNTNFIRDRGRRYRTIYGLRLGFYVGPHKPHKKQTTSKN